MLPVLGSLGPLMYLLFQWFSTRAILPPPRESLAKSGDILGCRKWGRENCYRHLVDRGRDAIIPTVKKRAQQQKRIRPEYPLVLVEKSSSVLLG